MWACTARDDGCLVHVEPYQELVKISGFQSEYGFMHGSMWAPEPKMMAPGVMSANMQSIAVPDNWGAMDKYCTVEYLVRTRKWAENNTARYKNWPVCINLPDWVDNKGYSCADYELYGWFTKSWVTERAVNYVDARTACCQSGEGGLIGGTPTNLAYKYPKTMAAPAKTFFATSFNGKPCLVAEAVPMDGTDACVTLTAPDKDVNTGYATECTIFAPEGAKLYLSDILAGGMHRWKALTGTAIPVTKSPTGTDFVVADNFEEFNLSLDQISNVPAGGKICMKLSTEDSCELDTELTDFVYQRCSVTCGTCVETTSTTSTTTTTTEHATCPTKNYQDSPGCAEGFWDFLLAQTDGEVLLSEFLDSYNMLEDVQKMVHNANANKTDYGALLAAYCTQLAFLGGLDSCYAYCERCDEATSAPTETPTMSTEFPTVAPSLPPTPTPKCNVTGNSQQDAAHCAQLTPRPCNIADAQLYLTLNQLTMLLTADELVSGYSAQCPATCGTCTAQPTSAPTGEGSAAPSSTPTTTPSEMPSVVASVSPSTVPSDIPSDAPTSNPTKACNGVLDAPFCKQVSRICPEWATPYYKRLGADIDDADIDVIKSTVTLLDLDVWLSGLSIGDGAKESLSPSEFKVVYQYWYSQAIQCPSACNLDCADISSAPTVLPTSSPTTAPTARVYETCFQNAIVDGLYDNEPLMINAHAGEATTYCADLEAAGCCDKNSNNCYKNDAQISEMTIIQQAVQRATIEHCPVTCGRCESLCDNFPPPADKCFKPGTNFQLAEDDPDKCFSRDVALKSFCVYNSTGDNVRYKSETWCDVATLDRKLNCPNTCNQCSTLGAGLPTAEPTPEPTSAPSPVESSYCSGIEDPPDLCLGLNPVDCTVTSSPEAVCAGTLCSCAGDFTSVEVAKRMALSQCAVNEESSYLDALKAVSTKLEVRYGLTDSSTCDSDSSTWLRGTTANMATMNYFGDSKDSRVPTPAREIAVKDLLLLTPDFKFDCEENELYTVYAVLTEDVCIRAFENNNYVSYADIKSEPSNSNTYMETQTSSNYAGPFPHTLFAFYDIQCSDGWTSGTGYGGTVKEAIFEEIYLDGHDFSFVTLGAEISEQRRLSGGAMAFNMEFWQSNLPKVHWQLYKQSGTIGDGTDSELYTDTGPCPDSSIASEMCVALALDRFAKPAQPIGRAWAQLTAGECDIGAKCDYTDELTGGNDCALSNINNPLSSCVTQSFTGFNSDSALCSPGL